MSYKVVIDSCGELLDEWKQDPRFESVALTLSVDGVNIIDDETFDQADFLKRVAECPECPKSACPSPERYIRINRLNNLFKWKPRFFALLNFHCDQSLTY